MHVTTRYPPHLLIFGVCNAAKRSQVANKLTKQGSEGGGLLDLRSRYKTGTLGGSGDHSARITVGLPVDAVSTSALPYSIEMMLFYASLLHPFVRTPTNSPGTAENNCKLTLCAVSIAETRGWAVVGGRQVVEPVQGIGEMR